MGTVLDGVTTAVVLFLFACLVIPGFIKNRPQYFAAFGAVLGIILVNTVALMIGSVRFDVFAGVIVGFLQLVAVIMLVMCCGGMTMSSLAGEMGHAFEVMRRGEDTKEVIIPLSGAMPKVKDDAPRERIEIVEPVAETKTESTESSES
ncbi:MAG TPA: hypothetical protein VHS31_14720 [Tepidisphaeraceae bacterium]|jgi:hypothetical protein|nr:hypothetical protein [Tepidisphaeraceae bacterium]